MSTTDAIAASAELVLAHVNADHPDALLLIAQGFGDQPDVVHATAVGVDGRGFDLVATDPGGAEHALRVDFPEAVDDVLSLRLQSVALVQLARERCGSEGTTSLERALAAMAAIRTLLTTVSAVRQVTPHVRRITFAGGDLGEFQPIAPDQFFYLLLPPPGRRELTIDRGFSWAAYEHMPDAERPVGAYYTVRAWRPDVQELDIDVVLHTPHGPASGWAATAEPGDPVALWGPRTSFEPPADTAWYLLLADDTGVPALSGILDALPAGTPVRAFAEVADAEEIQPLRDDPAFEVTWLVRDGAAPGTTTALLDAVRGLDWPDRLGVPYVWGGGESRALTAVRRHVRNERGLPREAVSLVAYWRRVIDGDDDISDLTDPG